MITFLQPVWLLLLIPLAGALIFWPLPGALLRILRAAVFALLVLAMTQLAVRLPDRSGTVVVVADRSDSMPKSATASQLEIIGLLQKSMGPRDLLGVVSFGGHSVVEMSPQRGAFGGFSAQVEPGHSDIYGAISAALSLIPPDGGGRILVLSDGKWTGRDPGAAAARAAGRGVPVDYRLMARLGINDVAIQSFQTPESVLPGQAYILGAWVHSPADLPIGYELRRGSTVIASGTKQVPAGLSRLMFRDRAGRAGVCDYTLSIQGAGDDPVPENNRARALVGVEGSRPLLLVSSAGEGSGLLKLLRAGNIDVVGKTPGQCRWSLEELSQYSAVLVENVPASQLGAGGMETLASWVEDAGGGLMMTGGRNSYGPGGYFKSPIDRLLPVSMEMRREHRKLSLAIVVALDRSGSMALSAGGGRTKMDLADLGTVQVLDLLSPMDEMGVIAVDTEPHVIVPLDSVANSAGRRGEILSINSQGGGIYIYEALGAAAGMIARAQAQTRHIILFADAADSRQHPGNYWEIVEKCRQADVTVSVVGLGTEADSDADILKDIAQRGGGSCYFSDDPDEIPRLFAQDTFTVARSTFIDQPSPFQFTAAFSLLGSMPQELPPNLGGYNLSYLRPEASLDAVTGDDYKAPVVASWNVGNGRVLCFSGEADGKFSGPMASWGRAGEFYATLARWTAGRQQTLPADEVLQQQVRDGMCFVRLNLDPRRAADPFAGLPRVKVLHGQPGAPPARQTVSLEWKTADALEAAIPLSGNETLLNTVEIPGHGALALPPVCLPYSPEFAPEPPGRGAAALEQIATTTGGKERIEIPQIWQELPSIPRYVELTPWLFLLAAIVFLVEILERRTGWVSRLGQTPSSVEVAPDPEEDAAPAGRLVTVARSLFKSAIRKPQSPAAGQNEAPGAAAGPAASSAPAPVSPSSAESGLDSLRKARERAGRRTGLK